MTVPGSGTDKPLIFNWGDNSLETPAAWDEVVTHTYASPGDYLITVREAANSDRAVAPFSVVANPATPVLTVDDATIKTCELSPFNATLTNGFGQIDHVYSYVTMKATGLTAANTLYQRQSVTGDPTSALTTIALTDLPDGSVRAIFGPFAVSRDVDTVVNYSILVPTGVTGPIVGHTDYVTSMVENPNTGVEELSVLISDDFTLTVTAGDCSAPPTPGACSITSIVPAPNDTETTYDADGNPIVTNIPQQITTGQGVLVTGTGLIDVAAMVLVSDDDYGYPCELVGGLGDDTSANGTVGQLPTTSVAHFKAVLVQNQDNTARCQIAVDWDYTPGPIPEV